MASTGAMKFGKDSTDAAEDSEREEGEISDTERHSVSHPDDGALGRRARAGNGFDEDNFRQSSGYGNRKPERHNGNNSAIHEKRGSPWQKVEREHESHAGIPYINSNTDDGSLRAQQQRQRQHTGGGV
ncbi:hypothetical protein HK102_009565, partial [Quaeritorhiza haematococci]